MPIYEYQCRECSHRLEKLQKLSDAPLTLCPACGEEALTKLVSAAAFRLKGGGWYETDFKKDGKRNLAGDESGAKAESGGGKDAGQKDSGQKDSTGTDSGKKQSGQADSGGKAAGKPSGEGGKSSKSSGGKSGATSSAA
ncbi:MAG: zinc ribbon domain-containing protein [Wenzhouxiangellaceae bacterium]